MGFLGNLYNTLANPVKKLISPGAPMQFPVSAPPPQTQTRGPVLPGPRLANVPVDPTKKLIADQVAKAQAEQAMVQGPQKRIARAGSFIKDVARAIPRSTASLALSASGQNKPVQPGGAGLGGSAQRLILGDEPIEPMQQKLATFTNAGEAFAKSRETPEQRKKTGFLSTVSRLPAVLPAALLGGSLEAVNFDPGVGGVEKKVAEKGLELAARESSERLAREGGEQLVKNLAEKVETALPEKFLPKELANAKPRFSFGEKSFTPQFESDVDKAAFILAQKNPSKREADYLSRTMANTGMSEAELRAHGKEVKSTIKTLARDTEAGKPLVIPAQSRVKPAMSVEAPAMSRVATPVEEQVAKEAPIMSKELPVASEKLPESTPELKPPEQTTKQLLESPIESPAPDAQSVESSSALKSSVNPEKPYFNLERLDISPTAKVQAKAEIERLAPETEKIVGKPLTHDEVLKTAQETQDFIQHTPVLREETKAWEANNLKLRQELAYRLEHASKEGGTLDPETINLFFQSKSINEDLGRKLGSLAIDASPKERNAINVLLEQVRKTGATADEVANAAKSVDFSDPKQVQEFYRSFVKPKLGDWLDLLRYNSMLSSPLTHIQNISSNLFGSAMLAPLQKEAAGLVDAARAVFSPGHQREAFTGEGAAYVKGYVKSFGKAVDDMTGVMTGRNFLEHPDLPNIPLATTKAGKAAESVLSFPMKALEAADRFFQALAGGGELAALEHRAAKGGIVKDLAGEAERGAAERLFRGGLFPKQQGKILNTVDELTRLIQGYTHSENRAVSTVSKFTLPFIKTPMNILKQGIEYSPLGFSTLWGAKNQSEQLSKAMIGTLTAAGIGGLIATDRLTGEEPVDPTQRKKFQEAGMKAYSVKVGNKWYSYDKLHPALAFNFAIMSAVDQAWKAHKLDDSQGSMILGAVARYGKFFADQSYMKSIGEFIDAIRGNEEGWGKVAANYSEQLIPFRAMMGWVNNVVDPVKRQADPNGSILDQQMQWIMSQIPGLSQKVPARTDSQGKPILKQHNIINALSPIKVSTENEVKGDRFRSDEEARLEFAPEMKEQKRLNAENTQKAQDAYWKLRGLPKEQANAEMKRLYTEDRAMFDKIKAMHDQTNTRLSSEEEQIKKLQVTNGARSQYLWKVLETIPDRTAKNAYLKDLVEKKIVTPEIIQQIKAMKDAASSTTP